MEGVLWFILFGLVGVIGLAATVALTFMLLVEERLRTSFMEVLNTATSEGFPIDDSRVRTYQSLGPSFLSRDGGRMVVVYSAAVGGVANRVNAMLDVHWLRDKKDGLALEAALRVLFKEEDSVLRACALIQTLSDGDMSRHFDMGIQQPASGEVAV